MATPLSLRMQRSRGVKANRQLIIFSLQQEWFALPLTLVEKVVAIDYLHAHPDGTETTLALTQNQDISVIAIQQRIFRRPVAGLITSERLEGDRVPSASSQQITGNYLLLVYDAYGELIGLPLDYPPTLRRVPESAFKPISATYQMTGNIRCLAGLIVIEPDSHPIFLLDLVQLLQPQQSLPASNSQP